MLRLLSVLLFVILPFISCQMGDMQLIRPKYDENEVKCLVCKAAVEEIIYDRKTKLNPKLKVEVGSYRLDSVGNVNKKLVPETHSEVKLSELIDEICERFDDYGKAKWKANNTLTIISMIKNGEMNPDISEVNLVQDDDLNRTLKYYCQNIVEENEEAIIKHLIAGTENIEDVICSNESKLCEGGGEPDGAEYYSPNVNDEL